MQLRDHPWWGTQLLKAPDALIVNSHLAKMTAEARGLREDRVFLLPNVIDLEAFDFALARSPVGVEKGGSVRVGAIGRHVDSKRFDVFLRMLAAARRRRPTVKGVLVGREDQETPRLEQLAEALGLAEGGVEFLGEQEDIPGVLRSIDILAVTSEHEGFPNVILEAMAAAIPVLTTSVGEAPRVVIDEQTGFVVPVGDVQQMADRLVRLVDSPSLRAKLGCAGRDRAADNFQYTGLGHKLLRIYEAVGGMHSHVSGRIAGQN
jgi:glycosyltransferase involved in cell wall biosynthesis